jgi:hypothetical protein
MASTVPGRVAARVPAAASPKQLIQSVSVLECDHLGACARQLPHKQVCLREHTVPQTGTANRQHESYANHVGLLVNILERPQQIRLHCADFGCIMGTYIANNCRAPSPWSSVIGSYIPALMKIVVAVPKWHIVAHVDKCFFPCVGNSSSISCYTCDVYIRRNNEIFKDGNGSGSGERSAMLVDFAMLASNANA